MPYTEEDVSRDPKSASELQQLGQRGVPVILVNGHMVVGFDRAQLERLLVQTAAAPGAKRLRLGASIADAVHHASPGSPPQISPRLGWVGGKGSIKGAGDQ